MVIHCQIPMPNLICNCVFCFLVFEDQKVNFHRASWFPMALVMVWLPGACWSIRPWWHQWRCWHWTSYHTWIHDLVMVNELGVGLPMDLIVDGCGYGHIAVPYPGHGVCDGWQIWPGSFMSSSALWHLSSSGDLSLQWNVKGGVISGWKWGWPGPLAMMHCSVMAGVINCQPSCRLNGLALSWACLPTQLMAPESVKMVFLTSPKLRPSPRDHLS